MSKTRILICDDQPLIRSSLELILGTDENLEVVGTAADGEQAVAAALALNPDVVLMDIQMPVLDGVAATARITAASTAKVVVLTTFDRDDYLFDAIDAGASGFLLKNTEPEMLLAAVHAAAGGQALLSPEVTLRIIRRGTGEERSSARRRARAAGPGGPAGPRRADGPRTRGAHPAGQRPVQHGDRRGPYRLRGDGENPPVKHPGQGRAAGPGAGRRLCLPRAPHPFD